MRLLHLTPELPWWPGGTGGQTRQFHLLRRLAERGHEVRVVAPVAAEHAGAQAALAAAGIELIGMPRPQSRVREGLVALREEPALAARIVTLPLLAWQVSVLWTALRPLARRALAERPPDAVTVEHDTAAAWVRDVPAEIPAALVLQNVSPQMHAGRARAGASGATRAWHRFEAARSRRHEGHWLPRYRRLIAVSEREAQALRSLRGVPPVVTVPNGVASDELCPAPPSSEPATLLFTGTLNHPPNSDGIVWFAEHCWPQVRAERPAARLLVVGRAPPPEVGELDRRDGIEVVGPVEDMAPWFARATAVVVPLRFGGGTRLKILEAFACGRAVVSTTIGAEGLDLTDGRDLLIADEPRAFAGAVGRLLGDTAQRERLAAAGRALAQRRYDWRVLGDGLAEQLERIASTA